MIKKIVFGLFLVIAAFLSFWGYEMYQFAKEGQKSPQTGIKQTDLGLQNGDIIFHTSSSNQSKAIQTATDSPYSHMGIIYTSGLGSYFVYEAIQPVQLTPLKNWINRGINGEYVVKRLKNADQVLNSVALGKMKKVGEKYKGKSYDSYFEWSDDKIYCSELVWKIYKEALDIEIGALQQLQEFDLNSSLVKSKMQERFGNKIPLTEKVISPAAMFDSDQLVTVKQSSNQRAAMTSL